MVKAKKLSEMTIEELWQLFPIYLTENRDVWRTWYAEEEDRLKRILVCVESMRISHIGSTAVKDIWAKPIIDILLEVPQSVRLHDVQRILQQHGYIPMSESEERISMNRGYTQDGFAKKVYHLHLRYHGDNDELYFRDYLKDNPEVAKQYECLKLDLWRKFEHDRDAYTESKTEFIGECSIKAKALFEGRYD